MRNVGTWDHQALRLSLRDRIISTAELPDQFLQSLALTLFQWRTPRRHTFVYFAVSENNMA
jgi:hypothetical protein